MKSLVPENNIYRQGLGLYSQWAIFPPQFSPSENDVHVDSNRDTVDVAVICEQDYYDQHS